MRPVRLAFLFSCLGMVIFIPSLFATGITFTNNCYTQIGFNPAYAPQPQDTTCGVVQSGFSDGQPGTVTANAVVSASYSKAGVITNTLVGSFSVTPSGWAYVNDTMKTTLSDTITLVGATGGQAYLSFGPKLLQTTLVGGPYIGDQLYAEGTESFNTLVSYNQPINLTETLTTIFQTGSQSVVLNNPVSGSVTAVATAQIELFITSKPLDGSSVCFPLPPQYTLQSDLGINYDVVPLSLAPEPSSTSLVWISIIGLILAGVRLDCGSRKMSN